VFVGYANPHPMKEIVDRILKEEEEARKAIERARSQAQETIRQAEAKARALLEDAHTQAQTLAQERKNQAAQEFLRQKQDALRSTETEISSRRQAKEKDIPAVAHRVFLKVISIEE
jgi:vacuolar-type H+-ATPase subunit H